MSRKRILIIGIAALVLLGGAVALLFLLPEAGTEDTPEVETPETYDAIAYLSSDVKSIDYTPRGGPSYTITRNPEDGTLSMSASRALFPFKSSDVSYLFTYSISHKGLTRVVENASESDFEKYGLADPFIKWRINLSDGTSAELAMSDDLLERYLRVTGDSSIYIMDTNRAARLARPIEEYYNLSFLPDYITPATEDETTWAYFTSILLERAGETIELGLTDDEAYGSFKILQPEEADVNSYYLTNSFLTPITNISPGELVESKPSDLSKYGLDDPIRLELTDLDGWSGVLLIGKYDPVAEGRYVMIEGINAVLIDYTGDYVFAEMEYHRLRMGLVWMHYIGTVKSVDFDLNGVKRRVVYEHGEDDELSAWLDGKEISEANGRRIYVGALSITVDDRTDTEPAAAAPEYTITINFIDGGSSTLELFALNERQYLMVLDGTNTEFIVFKSTLRDSLLSRFDIIDSGGEIPMS